MKSHTDGPWAWERESRNVMNLEAKDACVLRHVAAWIPSKKDRELIAAAPDLLEAAEAVIAERDTYLMADDPDAQDGSVDALYNALRAAVAKARGPDR